HPGDITRYHLPPGHCFSGAICLCNTINHLVEPYEVEGFLHSTAQALRPGGVLILDSDRLETFEGFFNHPPTVVWDDGIHCMTRFCEFDPQTGRAYHTATLEKYVSGNLSNPEKVSKLPISQESMMLQYHPQESLEASFAQAGFEIAEALLYNPCPQLYQGFYPKILWILRRIP
ncbi:MAG: hypothetical protein K2X66_04690, partial [Cyanobacteria bacterium]|nr:hypothetical protein [Cyanobacteriota bacterium]